MPSLADLNEHGNLPLILDRRFVENEPLADTRASDSTHDRKGAVLLYWHKSRGQRPVLSPTLYRADTAGASSRIAVQCTQLEDCVEFCHGKGKFAGKIHGP